MTEPSSQIATLSQPNAVSDWPPHLALETKPVLHLFTGENFYSSADAAIREVVLNAIDAIDRRSALEGAEIAPAIDVTFDRNSLTLTVSDNGDGMNQSDLTQLFSKIGASASALASGTKRSAIGEFGIGALSYFLVCDRYHIQTKKAGAEPIGLEYSEVMRDGATRAVELVPERSDTGTTVTMFLKSVDVVDLLIQKFPHWIRNVRGLAARIQPDARALPQGGLTREVRPIAAVEQPNWVEKADIGPAQKLDVWDHYDGKGRVDILYRGVFVERIEVDRLWGLEGAIHVDPKHFRPKLNREGFVGQELAKEVTPFFTRNHPEVLREAINCIHQLLEAGTDWNFSKALRLWLAVPRSTEYKAAASVWDAEFKKRKAFRLLERESDRDVSVAELLELNAEKIYLAPDNTNNASDIVRHAMRVLRARNSVVVQGLRSDNGYLRSASVNAEYSSWLLLHTFKEQLPPVQPVESVAEQLIRQDSLADVFVTAPHVKLVRLGNDSAPILAIQKEIWINIDSPKGRLIVEEVCSRNEGHIGLWVACLLHAPELRDHLNQIGKLLSATKEHVQRLGLVRRQYLRGLIK